MKRIILICFLISGFTALAQQEAQYSQYMFNGLVINPAYAGNKKLLNINAVYRSQWVGLEGAPETQTISMDALVPGSKSGVGLYIVNDRIGAQGQLGGYLNYSYKVKISKKSDVSFGLAGGASQYSLDGDKIILSDNDDSSIPQQNISAWAPDAKFGVFFSKDEGYVGLSVSGLLGNKISYNFGNTTTEINLSRHYYLTGGYIFDLNNNVKCYPSFLLKEDFKSPTGYDINTFMQFNGKFWLGFSYRGGFQLFKSNLVSNLRKSNVIAFIFELEVNKSVRIGYAFDYSTSALNDYNHGSHEIGLSYIFPGKKFQKMLSPRYF